MATAGCRELKMPCAETFRRPAHPRLILTSHALLSRLVRPLKASFGPVCDALRAIKPDHRPVKVFVNFNRQQNPRRHLELSDRAYKITGLKGTLPLRSLAFCKTPVLNASARARAAPLAPTVRRLSVRSPSPMPGRPLRQSQVHRGKLPFPVLQRPSPLA